MKKIIIIIVLSLVAGLGFSQSLINNENRFYQLSFDAELGFISILNHTIKSGSDGTNFNYITQGGQDVLFPHTRFEIALDISKHRIKFLYQPLEVKTSVKFYESVKVDTVTFAANTPMELTYSFPFWRGTYLYDFSRDESLILAGGLALQIRNASIVFKEAGGQDITVSQNIGPVPALSLQIEKTFNSGLVLGFDATGSYASSSLINGASFNFEGSLLDTSIRAGFLLKNNIEWYLLARFLGGSATGNSEYVNRTWSENRTTYTDNQLATLIIATGVKLK